MDYAVQISVVLDGVWSVVLLEQWVVLKGHHVPLALYDDWVVVGEEFCVCVSVCACYIHVCVSDCGLSYPLVVGQTASRWPVS